MPLRFLRLSLCAALALATVAPSSAKDGRPSRMTLGQIGDASRGDYRTPRAAEAAFVFPKTYPLLDIERAQLGGIPTGPAGTPNPNVVTVQGVSGGSGIPVTGNQSNASSGLAPTSGNIGSNSYLYGFNGTSWDQLTIAPASTAAQASQEALIVTLSPNSAGIIVPPLPTTPAVTGPFTAPTLAESVVQPDDLAISGSCSSACGNTTLFSQDMAGYQSASVQISSNAASNTIAFQTCDDTSIANCNSNSRWIAMYCAVAASNGSTSSVISGIAATSGTFRCPKWGEFFRVETTTYVSGTVAVIGHLHTYPVEHVVNASAYILAPLGSQTPAAGVATTPTGYTYGHISTDTTTTLKSGAGVLHTICVNSVGAASTITVDDATSATTPTIAVLSGATLGCYTYDIAFSTGLTIVTAVAAPDLTVAYR